MQMVDVLYEYIMDVFGFRPKGVVHVVAAPAGPEPPTPEPKKISDIPTICEFEDRTALKRQHRQQKVEAESA